MIRKIRQAAVIGAGVMGGGIAALLSAVGIRTLLLDITPPESGSVSKADSTERNRIAKAGLDAALNAKPALFMSPEDAGRIHIGNTEDDFQKLSACDWIVEAVIEDLSIKQQLLKRVDAVRRSDAIVSSNTSGIPLQEMAAGLSLGFQQHFLGTHFFNPVRYMKLLEIVPSPETLPEIIAFMEHFCTQRLGKGVVQAKDTPNFIANRIGVYSLLKALHEMAARGLTVPQVDALFGPVMGRPKTALLRLADLVGLDTLGHIARNTHDAVSDDPDREVFVLPDFFERMIGANRLGNKAGAGFYKTEKTMPNKTEYLAINPETLVYEAFTPPAFECLKTAADVSGLPEKMRAVLYSDDPGARFAWNVTAATLIYAARRIPEIADTVVAIDRAMRWGFNFELGPFEQWDAIGLAASAAKMAQEGFEVPQKIERMLTRGFDNFYRTDGDALFYYDFLSEDYRPVEAPPRMVSLQRLKNAGRIVRECPSASLVDLDDGVFCFEFHTKMNAINQEIVGFMAEAIDVVDAHAVGLVIGNQSGAIPGAFSAGGDLGYMASLADGGRFDEIDAFLKQAQETLLQARYAPFPVVAAPFGMTLGGGCEVCLAADRVVAHADLYMGLVEIGVGLLPAGGGCLNLWRKFLSTIPGAVEDVNLAEFFMTAFMSVAMAEVSESAAQAREKGFLGPTDRIVMNRDGLIGEAKKEVLKMAEDGYRPPLRRKIRVMGRAAQGMVDVEIFNMFNGKFVSEYDVFLARRIAYVMSGGNVKENSEIDESVILTLERQAFLDFWKEEKTRARVAHMLKTGKPLRN